MTIADALLPEFDREMGLTRRVLERVPDGQFAWKPHEKSMTLGRLAEHLAEMPMWLDGHDHGQPASSEHAPAAPDYTVTGHPRGGARDVRQNVAEARTALAGRATPS